MAGQLASFFVYIGRYMYIYDIYGGVSLAVAQELVRCRLVCLSLVTFAYLSFMQMRVNFRLQPLMALHKVKARLLVGWVFY